MMTGMSEIESFNERKIVQFLLRELPEESRLKLEERMFQDDGFYQQVVAVQEELADDYVQGNLSAPQSRQFEKYFLQSPHRRNRVEFAAALTRALAESNALERSATDNRAQFFWSRFLSAFTTGAGRLAWVAAVTLLALLIGVSWLVIKNRRLSQSITQARLEQNSLQQQTEAEQAKAAQRIQELESEIAGLRTHSSDMEAQIQKKQQELESLQRGQHSAPATAGNSLATFILTPGLTRGTDEPEKIRLSSAARSVQLQFSMEREEGYKTYLIELRTARGRLVLSRSSLSAIKTEYGQSVTVTIPTSLLPVGEYEVSLKGVSATHELENLNYYYFIALKP